MSVGLANDERAVSAYIYKHHQDYLADHRNFAHISSFCNRSGKKRRVFKKETVPNTSVQLFLQNITLVQEQNKINTSQQLAGTDGFPKQDRVLEAVYRSIFGQDLIEC